MKFHYEARTQNGSQQAGVIESSSKEAALQILDKKGFYITLLESAEHQPFYAKRIALFERVATKDVMLFSRQLSIMFKSGVSLVEALTTIAEQLKGPFREKLIKISEEVEAGTPFSEALSRHRNIFSMFYIQMIRRGEVVGNLSDVLNYLAEHLEWEHNIQSKVKGAMIYPIAVLTFLAVKVLPGLTTILQASGQDLPLITDIVVGFVDVYRTWWWAFFLAIGGFVFGLMRLSRIERARHILNKLSLRIPIFGSLLRMLYLTRFGENLATLIAGGVPIVQALEITGAILSNDVYQRIVYATKDAVAQGETITSALIPYPREFPPVFVQMVNAGEKSGALDATLSGIVKFYQGELERKIDTFLSLIQPAMIVILGGLVGVVLAAIMIPLYQVVSTTGT